MDRFLLLVVCCVLVVGLLTPPSVRCNEKTTEAPGQNTGESVSIRFMDLKKEEFLEKLPLVKESMAKYLFEYCAQKEHQCVDYPRMNISADGIDFVGQSDKDKYHVDGRFVIGQLKARVDELNPYKTRDQLLTTNLPKEKIKDFVKKYRQDIVDRSGVAISHVDQELIYPQRNNIDNWIIVSVSCAFCLFLIIFNLICQRKIDKAAKEEFLKKASELKPLIRAPIEPSSRDPAAVTNTYEVTGGSGNIQTDYRLQQQAANRPASQQQLQQQQQPTQSISRHDSFDQKLDKLQGDTHLSSGKRRKKSRSGSNGSTGIAGNLGSGIGSPRNMSNSYEHDLNTRTSAVGPGGGGGGSRRQLNISSGSINARSFAPPPHVPSVHQYQYQPDYSGEVQIPIQRIDSNFDRRNYQVETINVNEYPDPRVAYRLASN